jgi:hypothetical protein
LDKSGIVWLVAGEAVKNFQDEQKHFMQSRIVAKKRKGELLSLLGDPLRPGVFA